MPLHKLTKAQIAKLPPGKHGDGGGLWIVKKEGGGHKWLLRFSLHGRRCAMGLGGEDTDLDTARQRAADARELVRQGIDPRAERRRQEREQARLWATERATFAVMAQEVYSAKKSELSTEASRKRWLTPVTGYVTPTLGPIPVTEITGNDLARALRPIWRSKPETARKALERTGQILKHAAARDLPVDLNLTVKARTLLGPQKAVVKHRASVPWREMPSLYMSLGDSIAELALRFTILTGLRVGGCCALRRDDLYYEHAEMDGGGPVWHLPPRYRLKKGAKTPLRVPLSPEAENVIRAASPATRDGYLFVAQGAKPVTTDWVIKVLRDHYPKDPEVTTHGFRATFRDWAENEGIAYEVRELCLDHSPDPDRVVAAYRRDDRLHDRRVALERWAAFLTSDAGDPVHPPRQVDVTSP
ncbi:integrase arm-type DNA-binding domain-containing protein [Rhodobacterales bacterium HKCCSP123]|nr:integrase arm-type DNA-binding domain-containing protein [Rhodobacterales bacterium HKCCSP123]